MKRTILKSYLYLSILLLIFSHINEANSTGVLYVRPRFSSVQYEKVWIKSLNVDVSVQDQVAETHVDQVFFNELTQSAEAIYIFPLPENAMISELVYWVNGERFVAEIRERQEAINDYNQKLREWLDPALLEYLGDNLFRLSIVPVNAQSEFRTEITYIELLNYDFGVSKYKFLMNTLELSSKALLTVHFDLYAKTQNTFKYFQSPSHENSAATQILKHADDHYTMEFGDENFFPDKDVIIEMETVREEVEFSLLTYTPAPEDSFGTDSFYALWITPPDSVEEEEIIPKDIVFTADVSSSMEGERINQVKQALNSFLDKLNTQDRFNIITFATHVVKFRDNLIEAEAGNITAAHNFVYEMYALGMTNISAALDSSLAQSYRKGTSKNMIFLTDGEPTMGQTIPDSILFRTRHNNINNVRIFSFGVGEDINKSLLTSVSLENYGYPTFITSDDSIALLITNHFKRISLPVMTDMELYYGRLQVWDRYPKTMSDLFWGTQVLELGLYNGNGSYPVTLSGWIGEDSVSFIKTYEFTDTLGGFRFVPRLWAQAKINHLLDLIAVHGETEELVNQIIELSLTFQILTPYTAFYVDPTDLDNGNTRIVSKKFKLFTNYPNPFNPETIIKYVLPSDKASYQVKIVIYDNLGQLVLVLKDELQSPGIYIVKWNGQNAAGQAMPSGVYLCVLQAGSFKAMQKMLLVR
jgi:Ca-activated chloride channel family protein